MPCKATKSITARCKTSLHELDARSCSLDSGGVAQVSRLLTADGNALRRLLLPGAGSLSEPARMRVFASALASSETLELLQLGASAINSAGASALAQGLTANRSLIQLELQHNPLLDAEGEPRLASTNAFMIWFCERCDIVTKKSVVEKPG